jgi:uncharacterized coiled-coil protein SlyX
MAMREATLDELAAMLRHLDRMAAQQQQALDKLRKGKG